MKSTKIGKRHTLLFYRRFMDQLWPITLFLGVFLLAFWWWKELLVPEMPALFSAVILGSGVFALALGIFALLARNMTYAQARSGYFAVVTPFLRLKISYRRIRAVHPAEFQQLFPVQNTGWAQKEFLSPFYGKTVLVVELFSFPVHPRWLRLFLPAPMFLPTTTGLVFVVKDWMLLSTDIDIFQGRWKQSQSPRGQPPAPGLLQSLRKK